MKDIAKNEYYEIRYDVLTNRIYWTMKGFWSSMAVTPKYDADWDTVTKMTTPGFTICADLSKLKAMPKDVQKAQETRQAKVMQAGCKRVGVIIEDVAAKFALNEGLEKNGMNKVVKYCSDINEAMKFIS
jgi:hypothetical protein